ncbi:MAG: hypothetical protein HKL90_10025, partial [Elusimicrobia bacterium]|nr:hypothetical protein [Elusimicrobiota bacterium]
MTKFSASQSAALRRDPIRHIVWRKDRLAVLDQRLLPRRVVYVSCRSARDVAR